MGPIRDVTTGLLEHPDHQGNPLKSNLGMYRVQLSGNAFETDREIGIHYQIHRGIGVHQKLHQEQDKPFRVAVFVGGAPSMAFSAVMPFQRVCRKWHFRG